MFCKGSRRRKSSESVSLMRLGCGSARSIVMSLLSHESFDTCFTLSDVPQTLLTSETTLSLTLIQAHATVGTPQAVSSRKAIIGLLGEDTVILILTGGGFAGAGANGLRTLEVKPRQTIGALQENL